MASSQAAPVRMRRGVMPEPLFREHAADSLNSQTLAGRNSTKGQRGSVARQQCQAIRNLVKVLYAQAMPAIPDHHSRKTALVLGDLQYPDSAGNEMSSGE